MRYLMTTYAGSTEPDEKMYAEMGAFVEELTKSGVLLAGGGLEPGGTHASSHGGKLSFTDGPYTEAKELIVSFALVEVRDKDEALEIARRFWAVAGEGESDIRQVFS